MGQVEWLPNIIDLINDILICTWNLGGPREKTTSGFFVGNKTEDAVDIILLSNGKYDLLLIYLTEITFRKVQK